MHILHFDPFGPVHLAPLPAAHRGFLFPRMEQENRGEAGKRSRRRKQGDVSNDREFSGSGGKVSGYWKGG